MKMKTLRILTAMALLTVFVGCDDDDEFDDHDVPAGLGSIVIDNNTFTKIDIFLDGIDFGRVGDFDERFIDIEPGEYRLVLDEDGSGDRAVAMDVDILEGRLTVVDVDLDIGDSSYIVDVFLNDD
jgi:hypothetical protein